MSDLFIVNGIRAKLDVKEISEAGFGTSSASANVTITLTKSFANLTAITVTPKPTVPDIYSHGVVFDETAPNPTSFQVFIYNKNGVRAAIPFSWMVRGTQGA